MRCDHVLGPDRVAPGKCNNSLADRSPITVVLEDVLEQR